MQGALALAPNLRFTAPELSQDSKCSTTSDIFSFGCLIYYLISLDLEKRPYIIDIENPYTESHFLSAIRSHSSKLS
jgi:serine/threonine protein kinase